MQRTKDNQTVSDKNELLAVAILCVIGDREDQQDSFGYSLRDDGGLITVCDGMGGHKGGQIASYLAVNTILSTYEKDTMSRGNESPEDILMKATVEANEKISALTDENGNFLHAGSTEVAVIIQNGKLYWNSVGDSRAILFRGGEHVQFTQDQNYQTVLNERLRTGLITQEEFDKESVRGEALISYLGIGNLQLIDYNQTPLQLFGGDKILIMSDGLYKVVEEEDYISIVENFSNSGDALQVLEMKAQRNASVKKISRDNMTAALIKIN